MCCWLSRIGSSLMQYTHNWPSRLPDVNAGHVLCYINMQEDNRGLVNLEWYIGVYIVGKGRLVIYGRWYFCVIVTDWN